MSLKRKFSTDKVQPCSGFTLISKACKGFTLIELLVVIAILGILSVIGLGSFQSSQMKGRDAQRKQDLGQIQRALEMYYNDKKEYPDALPAASVEWQDTSVTDGALYMKSVPGDPKGGNYCYESNVGGTWYKLYAKLENSQDSKIIDPASLVCTLANGYNYGVSSSNETP